MFKWPYEKYEGNKSEFRDPYLEQLKQQLRAGNCYRIATGEEKEVIDANVEDLNGIDLKLHEKTAGWCLICSLKLLRILTYFCAPILLFFLVILNQSHLNFDVCVCNFFLFSGGDSIAVPSSELLLELF